MKKRLENMSPEEQMDLVNNRTYEYHINIDNNFLKRGGFYVLASAAVIATATLASHFIVHHPEYLSLGHIKNSLGF